MPVRCRGCALRVYVQEMLEMIEFIDTVRLLWFAIHCRHQVLRHMIVRYHYSTSTYCTLVYLALNFLSVCSAHPSRIMLVTHMYGCGHGAELLPS